MQNHNQFPLAVYGRIYDRRPPLYFGTYLRRKLGRGRPQISFPPWLNRAFADRLGLLARWQQAQRAPPSVHPARPEAYDDPASGKYDISFLKVQLDTLDTLA